MLISLIWKRIFQKEKRHSLVFWKAFQIRSKIFFISYARIYSFSTKISSNKIRSDPTGKGNNLFGNELKLIQFADDTKLFYADLILAQKTFNIVSDFGKAGLREKEKG